MQTKKAPKAPKKRGKAPKRAKATKRPTNSRPLPHTAEGMGHKLLDELVDQAADDEVVAATVISVLLLDPSSGIAHWAVKASQAAQLRHPGGPPGMLKAAASAVAVEADRIAPIPEGSIIH